MANIMKLRERLGTAKTKLVAFGGELKEDYGKIKTQYGKAKKRRSTERLRNKLRSERNSMGD